MAEQAAIGQDVVDFAEALRIEQCALSGFDWGLRAACITSILHPELVKGFVAIGGYSVQNTIDTAEPARASREDVVPSGTSIPSRAASVWNTTGGTSSDTSGRPGRRPGPTPDEVFNRSAPSFDNPDFVDIVIHSYRHRHRNAPGEARFLDVERALANNPPITVPTIVLRAGDSGLGYPRQTPRKTQRISPRWWRAASSQEPGTTSRCSVPTRCPQPCWSCWPD